MTIHIWSDDEKEYLKKITPGHHYKEIAELMSNKFEMEFTVSQIKNAIGRYKLNTGFNGQFKKGNVPANKGVKGVIYEGCKKTWFKKGHTPINHRQVGSERINIYGYVEIKVAEPNKWKLKHHVIYEKHNGSIPKGYNVIFGDRNPMNFDIDNLILVSKAQLLKMNQHNLIKNDANITRTGALIADIYLKIGKRNNT